MNSLEYIDDYFKGALPPDALRKFEQQIESDPVFAEEVAFYLTATALLKEQADAAKKERFRQLSVPAVVRPMRMWYYAAAAVLLAVVVSVVLLVNKPDSAQQVAENFMFQKLGQLEVTMGSTDSLQLGIRYYNEKNYTQALAVFEGLAMARPAHWQPKNYAGLAALQAGDYEKAVGYFTRLSAQELEVNPGKFYHALTLLKRNQAGDAANAKALLQQVVDEGIYGNEEAREWLKLL